MMNKEDKIFRLTIVIAFVSIIFFTIGLMVGTNIDSYQEYKKGFEYGWELRGACRWGIENQH